MVCVVITRNGSGEAWRFASRQEALVHPLPQYGDVYASSARELSESFTHFEARELARFLGQVPRHVRAKDDLNRLAQLSRWEKEQRDIYAEAVNVVWEALVSEEAKTPPTDAATILSLITQDRRRMLAGNPRVPTPGVKSPTEEEDEDMSDTEKSAAFRIQPGATITLGTDADGKKYGADHNPKKGEKTADKFKVYVDGMTVEEAEAAGLTRSDIRRDRRKGYITITNPEPAENSSDESEAEEDAAA